MEHSPDDEGIMGLYLSKELPKQAGRVLEKCAQDSPRDYDMVAVCRQVQ